LFAGASACSKFGKTVYSRLAIYGRSRASHLLSILRVSVFLKHGRNVQNDFERLTDAGTEAFSAAGEKYRETGHLFVKNSFIRCVSNRIEQTTPEERKR